MLNNIIRSKTFRRGRLCLGRLSTAIRHRDFYAPGLLGARGKKFPNFFSKNFS